MSGTRLRIVASGDYLHTIGPDSPTDLGFGAFDGGPFELTLLPAAPQTDAVPARDLARADVLLLLGQYLPEASVAPVAQWISKKRVDLSIVASPARSSRVIDGVYPKPRRAIALRSVTGRPSNSADAGTSPGKARGGVACVSLIGA